jgi:hypothetical protein
LKGKKVSTMGVCDNVDMTGLNEVCGGRGDD